MDKIEEQDVTYKDALSTYLKGGKKLREEFDVEPKIGADVMVKMINKDEEVSDFRIYPGKCIKQIEKLNNNFSNNYQQNVQYGADLMK